MKTKQAIVVLATLASASVFAQGYSSSSTMGSSASTDGAVTSSSGASVSSGTGMVVTPGAPSTSVAVIPSTSVTVPAVPGNHLLPGAATVQASSTTVLGGPAAPGVSGSQTVVTRYWVNVPANVTSRADFQRWMALR